MKIKKYKIRYLLNILIASYIHCFLKCTSTYKKSHVFFTCTGFYIYFYFETGKLINYYIIVNYITSVILKHRTLISHEASERFS